MKKENLEYLSLPTKFELQPFQDDRFKKVKVYVMHDKLNLNTSNFEFDVIEDAKGSIANIPILGYVRMTDGDDSKDFGGHEYDVVWTSDGDVKIKYLGRPIGVIPAMDNNYHYETFDDKTYVVVEGYIWTDYANDALEILENSESKGQSMEIRIDEGYWDDEANFYNVKKYRYTGLCVLGDDVTPAMTGAKVQIERFSASNSTYHKMVEELSNILKFSSLEGGEKMEEENKLENAVNETLEDNAVIEGEGNPEVETPNMEDNSVELPTDEGAKADHTHATVETKPEFTIEDLKAEVETKDSQIFELNTKLSELQTKYEALESEVGDLKKFKADALAEKDMEEKEAVFADYTVGLTDEEMQPVKDKIKEFSVKEIKSALNEMFTAKNLAKLKKDKFSAKEQDEEVVMDVPRKENKSRYAV